MPACSARRRPASASARPASCSPTRSSQHYLVVSIRLTALLAIWIACRGQYGRVLAAIQGNELRASTLGHNTSLLLLSCSMLSAGLAALAGGLYASVSGFVAPDLIGLLLSTEVIVWVAVGGRGTLLGPFIGAFVVCGCSRR